MTSRIHAWLHDHTLLGEKVWLFQCQAGCGWKRMYRHTDKGMRRVLRHEGRHK